MWNFPAGIIPGGVENTISREAISGSLPSYQGFSIRAQQPTSKLKLPSAAPLLKTPDIDSASLTPVGRVATATTQSVSTFAQTPRYLMHFGMTAVVAAIVFAGSTGHPAKLSPLANQSIGYGSVLDAAAQASVAANVADQAGLLVASEVKQTATTLNSQTVIPTSGDDVLQKDQVVDTAGAVAGTTQTYTVLAGDTLGTIAQKFNITSDTIRWANNISDDTLKPGQSLTILPISGVQYKVQPGDTLDGLASKYQGNSAQIVAFNNLEVAGLQVGQTIVIPDGVIVQAAPAPRAVAAASTTTATRATRSNFVGGPNGYAFGYCTWYVANRRSVPGNWGNASAWYYNAQLDGYGVGSTPAPGAIAWTGAGYYGHVAYVESVSGGMVTVSEMNYNGNWDRVTSRTVPASSFRYIY